MHQSQTEWPKNLLEVFPHSSTPAHSSILCYHKKVKVSEWKVQQIHTLSNSYNILLSSNTSTKLKPVLQENEKIKQQQGNFTDTTPSLYSDSWLLKHVIRMDFPSSTP